MVSILGLLPGFLHSRGFRLISASVGTVVYYGFQDCHPDVGNAFLVCCLMTGVAGNAFPFFKWFDQTEYKVIISCSYLNLLLMSSLQYHRIAFFVSMALTAAAPMATLAYLQSPQQMLAFVGETFFIHALLLLWY